MDLSPRSPVEPAAPVRKRRNWLPMLVLGLVVVAGGVIVTQFLTQPNYDGEPGGIFKECIPVVVHGVIENGTLLGDRVEVKHSDEYVAVNDERVADAESAGCPGVSTS